MTRALIACLVMVVSCAPIQTVTHPEVSEPFIVVLGIAQDGGYPQAGCNAPHCEPAWENPELRRFVTSLAIVDPVSRQRWIIDVTPDFPAQLRALDKITNPARSSPRDPAIAGVFLTHAHVGHYAGLLHLGREVLGTRGIPVYAMPRMYEFLSRNGPWDQLVRLENITLTALHNGETIDLNQRIRITPLLVPHRDEYSETVGFRVDGPRHSAIFIPDIDKWERWPTRIEDLIADVDYAFLDGTFYADGEVPGRSMKEIPHPFIAESMQRLAGLPSSDRNKIHFIHLNHSNPALQPGSEARRRINSEGFHVAAQDLRLPL